MFTNPLEDISLLQGQGSTDISIPANTISDDDTAILTVAHDLVGAEFSSSVSLPTQDTLRLSLPNTYSGTFELTFTATDQVSQTATDTVGVTVEACTIEHCDACIIVDLMFK